jgi:UDP:flavonoid glycosyltransferase YjiC (YdhE family)
LAEGELEAEGDAEVFYKSSRAAWSDRLRHALDVLRTDDDMRDKASAIAEAMQMEPVTPPADSEE